MPTIRFRTTYSSPNSPGIPFKCCIDASSTEDAERKIMALFPNATNLQTFPEDGADSWDADGNKIDWSEAAQRRAKAQGVKTMNYDNWKLAAPHQDAPPLDAECEQCGKEDYQGNLVNDLCQDCQGGEE